MQTTSTLRVAVAPKSAPAKRIPYGTAPLELDLAKACELVIKLGKEGNSVGLDTFAVIAGNTTSSSALWRKISALQAYGLVEKTGSQVVTLTALGRSIAFPRSVQAETDAKKTAFLGVSKYNLVFQQHKGKLLPADEFLRNIFEQDGKVPRDYSEAWVAAFKSGARAAGLFHDRGDGRIQLSENQPIVGDSPLAAVPSASLIAALEPEPALVRDGSSADYRFVSRSVAAPPDLSSVSAMGHFTRIELSDHQRAEFSIPDRLTVRDAQKLKKAIEGLKSIIDSMVADDAPDDS
jgi:hypothetical protein